MYVWPHFGQIKGQRIGKSNEVVLEFFMRKVLQHIFPFDDCIHCRYYVITIVAYYIINIIKTLLLVLKAKTILIY